MVRIMGTLRENQYTFMTISWSVFPRIRNISEKNYRKIETNISCSIKLFFFENFAVYEVTWKYVYCRAGQATDDNMTFAHCRLDT